MAEKEKEEWGETVKVVATDNSDEWGETVVVDPKSTAPSTKGGESGALVRPLTPTSASEGSELESWTQTINPFADKGAVKPTQQAGAAQAPKAKLLKVIPSSEKKSPELLKARVDTYGDMYKRAMDRAYTLKQSVEGVDNELKNSKAYVDSNPNDQNAINSYNALISKRNEMAEMARMEIARADAWQKGIEKTQLEIDDSLTASESISNSISNMATQIKGFLPASGLAISTLQNKVMQGAIYATEKLMGADDETASKVSVLASQNLPSAGILGTTQKEASQFYTERLGELEKEQKPTKSIIKTFEEGDVAGLGAAILDGGSSVLSSVITSAPTGGVGIFTEMMGRSVYDFNNEKAKRLKISVDELYDRGLDEAAVPLAIGAVSASLEKIGLDGISKAINKKIGSKAVKDIFEIVLEGSKEAGTEWLQTGAEEYNKAIARGMNAEQAGEVALSKMLSEEGREAALKGAAGSGVSIATGRAAKSLYGMAKSNRDKLYQDLAKVETLARERANPNLSSEALSSIDREINNTTANMQKEVLDQLNRRANLTEENASLVEGIEANVKTISDDIESKKLLSEDPSLSDDAKIIIDLEIADLEAKRLDLAAQSEEIIKNNRPIELKKNTSPTSDKYGTINRNDGKGVLDLTKEEFEAEQAKMQPKVDEQVTPTAEGEQVPKTKEEIDAKKADIERRKQDALKSIKQNGNTWEATVFSETGFETGISYIGGTREDILNDIEKRFWEEELKAVEQSNLIQEKALGDGQGEQAPKTKEEIDAEIERLNKEKEDEIREVKRTRGLIAQQTLIPEIEAKYNTQITELEKQYEKEPTKKEDGEPMSGGVQGVRTEGQAGKESAELRPEEEALDTRNAKDIGDIQINDINSGNVVIGYHATPTGEIGTGKELGIHIGTEDVSNNIKKGRNADKGDVKKVAFRVNKPLILGDMASWSSVNVLNEMMRLKLLGIDKEKIREIRDSDLSEKEKQQRVIELAKEKGYDSFAYQNFDEGNGEFSYVLFDDSKLNDITPKESKATTKESGAKEFKAEEKPKVADPLKDVESTTKALEETIPKKDLFAIAVSLLPKAGVINYKDINKTGLPLSDYLNNPKLALERDRAKDIYEDIKSGKSVKYPRILLDENNKLLDGTNRTIARLANGETDFEFSIAPKGFLGKPYTESISETYHKAKADGSNPQLVEAVEQLLGKPKEATPQEGSVVGASLRDVELKMRRPEKNEVIFVSVDALLQKHAADQPSYDVQKEGNRIKGRVEKAKEFIKNYIKDQRAINPKTGERMNTKVSFEPSVVDIDANGKISFEDGRHRVLAAKEMGLTEVPIEVPKERVKAVEQSLQSTPKAEEKISGGLTQEEKVNLENISKDAGVNFQEVRNVYNKYGEGKPLNEITLEDYQKAEEKRQGGKEKEGEEKPEDKKGRYNQKFADSKKVYGEETTVEMANGETRDAIFIVVELDDILASHDEVSFNDTEGFPKTKAGRNVNSRNYKNDKSAQLKVNVDAKGLKPSIVISDAATTDTGVPVISKEGIVISGNGRTMAIKLSKKIAPEKYQSYKKDLIKRAFKYGLDSNEVAKMKNPIMVKLDRSIDDYSVKLFDDYNGRFQKEESPIDEAIKRSTIIQDNPSLKDSILSVISRHETMSDLFNNREDRKELLKIFLDNDVILSQEVVKYVSEDGSFTDDGKGIVNDILIATVLSPETLAATESVKAFRNKIINALPVLTANYALGENSLENELNEAVLLQAKIASMGNQSDFWKHLNQIGMFDVVNPDLVILNRIIESGRDKFKKFIMLYNNSMSVGDMNLFGGEGTMTKKEVIDQLKKTILDENERQIISNLEELYQDFEQRRQEGAAKVDEGVPQQKPTDEELLTPKQEEDAKKQQSGQMREQGVQDQPQRKGDSDMPIINEAELQDGEAVEEVEEEGLPKLTKEQQIEAERRSLNEPKNVSDLAKIFNKILGLSPKESVMAARLFDVKAKNMSELLGITKDEYYQRYWFTGEQEGGLSQLTKQSKENNLALGVSGKGFLTPNQIQSLTKEIESQYAKNVGETLMREKDDIRTNMFDYDNPIASKTVNGVDLRIAEGLIRDGKKTYLLYANGGIIGEFNSAADAKTAVKFVEDRLVKNKQLSQTEVTEEQINKTESALKNVDLKNIIGQKIFRGQQKGMKGRWFTSSKKFAEVFANSIRGKGKVEPEIIEQTILGRVLDFPFNVTDYAKISDKLADIFGVTQQEIRDALSKTQESLGKGDVIRIHTLLEDENFGNLLASKGIDYVKAKENLTKTEAVDTFLNVSGKTQERLIAEAYHRAKVENNNIELVKSVESLIGKQEGLPLFQERRGAWSKIAASAKRIISMYDKARLDTAVHEILGHDFLDEIISLSATNKEFEQDLNTIIDEYIKSSGNKTSKATLLNELKNFNVESNNQSVNARAIHEWFSRTAEGYFMGETNIKPDSKLAKMFEQFRQYLTDLFNTMTSRNYIIPSEPMKQIFRKAFGAENFDFVNDYAEANIMEGKLDVLRITENEIPQSRLDKFKKLREAKRGLGQEEDVDIDELVDAARYLSTEPTVNVFSVVDELVSMYPQKEEYIRKHSKTFEKVFVAENKKVRETARSVYESEVVSPEMKQRAATIEDLFSYTPEKLQEKMEDVESLIADYSIDDLMAFFATSNEIPFKEYPLFLAAMQKRISRAINELDNSNQGQSAAKQKLLNYEMTIMDRYIAEGTATGQRLNYFKVLKNMSTDGKLRFFKRKFKEESGNAVKEFQDLISNLRKERDKAYKDNDYFLEENLSLEQRIEDLEAELAKERSTKAKNDKRKDRESLSQAKPPKRKISQSELNDILKELGSAGLGQSLEDLNAALKLGFYIIQDKPKTIEQFTRDWNKITKQNKTQEELSQVYRDVRKYATENEGVDIDYFDSDAMIQSSIDSFNERASQKKNLAKKELDSDIAKAEKEAKDKDDAPSQLAKAILSNAKKELGLGKKQQDYVKELLGYLKNKAKDYYKTTNKQALVDPFEQLKYAVEMLNDANGRKIWDDSKAELIAKIDSDKDLSQQEKDDLKAYLDDYQNAIFDQLLSKNKLFNNVKKVLAEESPFVKKDGSVDWNGIIIQAKGNVEIAKQIILDSVADKLQGYSGSQVNSVIDAIGREYQRRINEKRAEIIEKQLKDISDKKVIFKKKIATGFVQKLVEMENSGALGDQRFEQALKEWIGFSDMTPDKWNRLRELIVDAEEAPEGNERDRAIENLSAYIKFNKIGKFAEIYSSAYYAGLLARPTTIIKNSTGIIEPLLTLFYKSFTDRNYAKAMLQGLKRGDAADIWGGGLVQGGKLDEEVGNDGLPRVNMLKQWKMQQKGIIPKLFALGAKPLDLLSMADALSQAMVERGAEYEFYARYLLEKNKEDIRNGVQGVTPITEKEARRIAIKRLSDDAMLDWAFAQAEDEFASRKIVPSSARLNRRAYEIVSESLLPTSVRELAQNLALEESYKSKLISFRGMTAQTRAQKRLETNYGVATFLGSFAKGLVDLLGEGGGYVAGATTKVLPVTEARRNQIRNSVERAISMRVLPFARGISNVVEKGLEKTPYGIVSGVVGATAEKLSYGKPKTIDEILQHQYMMNRNKAKIAKSATSMIIGSAIYYALLSASKEWDDEEEKEERYYLPTGFYSAGETVRFGKNKIERYTLPVNCVVLYGRIIPLSLFGTVGIGSMITAQAYDNFLSKEKKKQGAVVDPDNPESIKGFSSFVSSSGNAILNMSAMQSISELQESVSSKGTMDFGDYASKLSVKSIALPIPFSGTANQIIQGARYLSGDKTAQAAIGADEKIYKELGLAGIVYNRPVLDWRGRPVNAVLQNQEGIASFVSMLDKRPLDKIDMYLLKELEFNPVIDKRLSENFADLNMVGMSKDEYYDYTKNVGMTVNNYIEAYFDKIKNYQIPQDKIDELAAEGKKEADLKKQLKTIKKTFVSDFLNIAEQKHMLNYQFNKGIIKEAYEAKVRANNDRLKNLIEKINDKGE